MRKIESATEELVDRNQNSKTSLVVSPFETSPQPDPCLQTRSRSFPFRKSIENTTDFVASCSSKCLFCFFFSTRKSFAFPGKAKNPLTLPSFIFSSWKSGWKNKTFCAHFFLLFSNSHYYFESSNLFFNNDFFFFRFFFFIFSFFFLSIFISCHEK